MKKILLSTLLISLAVLAIAQDQTTFILVRHAEKADDGTRNPPLNEAGIIRARSLADLLINQEIAALYSTPYKRTQETLQPIADAKEIEVEEYDPRASSDWLKTLVEKHSGKTVIISGHSNTIPSLANSLLGTETFSQFDDSDYSNLIIIVTDEVGKGKLVRLSF